MSRPIRAEDNYSITYHAPQPRAVLRVVDANNTDETKNYGEWGRVELTTLTREFFMPRFPERDMCEREAPCDAYPWEGVRNVRPFQTAKSGQVTVGVY